MGAQSTLTLPGKLVSADQAVFTSIPSAGGSGYRIIAASAGLSTQERQEITQRCPSHASLTDDGPTTEALFSWSLRSGRYAVAWSRHAGMEHTGRGGHRVHTHLVVLDGPGYARFGFHAIRVYSAMLDALASDPLLESRPVLEPLFLPDPASTEHAWVSAVGIGCNREAVFAMLKAALAGEAAIVTGLDSSFTAVDAALAVLPLSLRAGVGVSIGLKYSTARPARLTILDGDGQEARRLTRGQPGRWIEAATLPTLQAAVPAPAGMREGEASWLTLARRWWMDGRRGQLCELAGCIDFKATPAALNRIAALCEDADAVSTADTTALKRLADRYAAFKPAGELEAQLVRRLREDIAARQRT